ncbi:Crp/Fnr family transcriptional regulator [Anaerobacillus sp. MEB173]|uniref:Crp/Fnr family transcriptional regulator n=1 Tax=Anaerobacillus sp. MEB173 TaxID=3383345 RepID=UPI003F90F9F7
MFKDLSEDHLMAIQGSSKQSEYQKGENIFAEGDKTDSLFIISKGRVKLYSCSSRGREQILRTLGPGSIIGEYTLFRNERYTFFAEALEKTKVCQLSKKNLVDAIRMNSELAVRLLDVMSQRLEQAEETIKQFGTLNVEQRIAQYLLNMPKNEGKVVDGQVELSISKKHLASLLGMSRETFSRKLSQFQKQGWVTFVGPNVMKLTDKEALENLLNEQ